MPRKDRLTPLYLPTAQLGTWAHFAADAGRKGPGHRMQRQDIGRLRDREIQTWSWLFQVAQRRDRTPASAQASAVSEPAGRRPEAPPPELLAERAAKRAEVTISNSWKHRRLGDATSSRPSWIRTKHFLPGRKCCQHTVRCMNKSPAIFNGRKPSNCGRVRCDP